MRRVRRLPILLAVLAVLVGGCGGGEDTSANQSTEPDVTTGRGGGGGGGDARAGEIIWVTESCNNCHTLAGNPATSLPGPNFDKSVPNRATIIDVVTNGKGSMQGFGDTLSREDIENVAAYVLQASGT